jgi:hypothetical protein
MAQRPSQANELTSLGSTDVIIAEDVSITDVGYITLTNFVASIDDLSFTFTATTDFSSATVIGLTSADVGLGNVPNEDATDPYNLDQRGASDGQVLTWDSGNTRWQPETISTANDKAGVSSNDTTPDYLKNKLVAGSGVTLTEQNDGGNETLKVDAGGSSLLRDFTATGTISTGDVVALRSDGTVEVVTETTLTEGAGTATVFESATSRDMSATYDSGNGKVVVAYRDAGNSNYGTAIVGTVSGTGISFGTATVFESAGSYDISATYDSAAGKVVIAYQDVGNSSYGTAVVGTVSGTSISFGSPTVFESADSRYISATYDSAAGKVVIAYEDAGNSSYGTAVVGTVSGTSISFGTATVFESAASRDMSATYDSAADKVVIAYRDSGNSSYGTAIVGTVSGTSISFGTATVFESAGSYDISATYDSAAGKVVIAYRDFGNSNYGTAVVGTVSGTSISFDTPTVFESAYSTGISATYDSAAGKVVIAYQDVGNSDYGTVIVGTVSGTSISFGTATVFESADSRETSATYDSGNGKVVIAYRDLGNSNYGTAIVWQNAYIVSNADDWIGVSQASLSDTQTGTMALKGAVDENQSGLTANNVIYLADDGTLQTTDNGRKLGRALASDTILLAAE